MATLTITTPGPLRANVDVTSNTIREPELTTIVGDLIELELGGPECSAVLVGSRATIAQLLREALELLQPAEVTS